MKFYLTGARLGLRSRFYYITAIALLGLAGCSLFVTRPVQEMSDTNAAIKAAKEVQADIKAPELYRQATEWFLRAKAEYKLKNFDYALEDAQTARHFAEEAEFEVIKNGGARSEDQQPSDQNQAPQSTPANGGNGAPAEQSVPPPDQSGYSTPTGTPATDFAPNGAPQPTPEATSGASATPTPAPNPTPTVPGMPPVNQ
jgi:hypothetical protein